jgi:hypothetical protein
MNSIDDRLRRAFHASAATLHKPAPGEIIWQAYCVARRLIDAIVRDPRPRDNRSIAGQLVEDVLDADTWRPQVFGRAVDDAQAVVDAVKDVIQAMGPGRRYGPVDRMRLLDLCAVLRSERKAAKRLGINRSTLREHRDTLIEKLGVALAEYLPSPSKPQHRSGRILEAA